VARRRVSAAASGPPVANVIAYDVAADRWSDGPALPMPIARRHARARRPHAALRRRLRRSRHHGRHALGARASTAARRGSRARTVAARAGHLASAVVDGRLYAIGGQIRHDTDRSTSTPSTSTTPTATCGRRSRRCPHRARTSRPRPSCTRARS
jgi:hypothetical protein